jgi:transcriptional regulator of arginine metabolism
VLTTSGIGTQAELQEVLAAHGFSVTQATVSRDLDAIGAVRVRNGAGTVYRLGDGDAEGEERVALTAAVDEFVESIAVSGHLIVLKTPPGAAHLVAGRIDAASVPGVIGTVAGDDTVMVITEEGVGAGAVAQRIEGTDGP